MEDETKSKETGQEDYIGSLVQNVENISLFLPSWIRLRNNAKEHFLVASGINSSAECSRFKTLQTVGSNIPFKGTIGHIANVMTLGCMQSYYSGKTEIDQKQFASSVNHLRSDMRETSCLEKICDDVLEDLRKFDRNNGDKLPDCGDNFFNWCKNFAMIVQKFKVIVSVSMKPCQLVNDFSSRNSQTCTEESKILEWTQHLESLLQGVIAFKEVAGTIIQSLENEAIERAMKNAGKLESTQHQSKDWDLLEEQLFDSTDVSLPVVQRWHQAIYILYVNSVSVASGIHRLLLEENLPPLLAEALSVSQNENFPQDDEDDENSALSDNQDITE